MFFFSFFFSLDMRQMPQCITTMFEWIGTRLSSWIIALCTGKDGKKKERERKEVNYILFFLKGMAPGLTQEKDAHGGGGDRTKTTLVKKLLSVLVECVAVIF